MTYEENIRSILKCCFFQTKEEIIETAVTAIMALKQEPNYVPIAPLDPIIYPPVRYDEMIKPYFTEPIDPSKYVQITCENLNNKEN